MELLEKNWEQEQQYNSTSYYNIWKDFLKIGSETQGQKMPWTLTKAKSLISDDDDDDKGS
jgi:hypothetical protein